MIKNSALLSDIRNIKRNNTITQKCILFSEKQIKKSRSSQQINLNQLTETKNQKIKNIDERLQFHQSEIQKNNGIISQLTQNFMNLKQQMEKEKQKTENQQKKNILLKQQIQRTNKLMRTKNLRIDQLNKKNENLLKDNQIFKNQLSKHDELLKLNNILRKQITHLQDSNSQKKLLISQKEKQIQRLKQISNNYISLKTNEDLLKSQINNLQKNLQKANYTLNQKQKDKNIENEKIIILQDKLHKKQNDLKQEQNKNQQLSKNLKLLKKKYQEVYQKMKEIQSNEVIIKEKLKQKQDHQNLLKSKIQELNIKNDQSQKNITSKNQQIHKKDQIIDKLNKKIKEFQTNNCVVSKEMQDLKNTQIKMQSFRKKSKNLQDLYKAMIPQIQCSYGHQLHNPVTVIPCGHNYCLGCKKGYTKECLLCCGKLKIQAVYRNQLMDDLIGIINSIRQVMQMIK